MIRSTQTACLLSGMPEAHARCFQQVADHSRCVISSRSVGRYATGLILENYASKGFHIKAKSCSWGPMAGFVATDPRYTKRGTSSEARVAQLGDVHSAIVKEHAGEMQVFVSDKRRLALEEMHCMVRTGSGAANERSLLYSAKAPGGKDMSFVLRQGVEVPGLSKVKSYEMWGVYHNPGDELPATAAAYQAQKAAAGSLQPVMALVNPHSADTTYRSAVTGDYDLWGVFPEAGQFDPGRRGVDKLMVPGSHRFDPALKTKAQVDTFKHQIDPHMGNISQRIIRIKDNLNAAIRLAGYTGGEMVHHGTETARPSVTEVEMEFIAFIPHQAEACFIRNMSDLKMFLHEVMKAGYFITLNPAWGRQLGFGATPKGSWEV